MRIGATIVGLDRLASGQRIARLEEAVRRRIRSDSRLALPAAEAAREQGDPAEGRARAGAARQRE